MRKTSWKTGADDGAERKSGATFRTIFRCGGLSGATIRTTQLPLFPTTCRGLFQKTDAESVAKLATSACQKSPREGIGNTERAASARYRCMHEGIGERAFAQNPSNSATCAVNLTPCSTRRPEIRRILGGCW